MIASAIEFYENNPEKPVDLSNAPHVERFEELMGVLLKQKSNKTLSLCDQERPIELLKLADYLGILPDNSLDILTLKCCLELEIKKEELNAQFESKIEELARTVLVHFMYIKIEKNEIKYSFKSLENYKVQLLYGETVLKTTQILMRFEKVIIKLKSFLFSRFKLITNQAPEFEPGIDRTNHNTNNDNYQILPFSFGERNNRYNSNNYHQSRSFSFGEQNTNYNHYILRLKVSEDF